MIENRSQSLYCLYFLFSRRVVSTFSRYLTRGRECVAEAPTGAAQLSAIFFVAEGQSEVVPRRSQQGGPAWSQARRSAWGRPRVHDDVAAMAVQGQELDLPDEPRGWLN